MKTQSWLRFLLAGGLFLSGCDGDEDASADARRWLELEIIHPKPGEPSKAEETVGEVEDELLTNTYIVPPSFLGSAPNAPDPDGDEFAVRETPGLKLTAQEVLEAYGVVFGPGANAFYSKKDSLLKVTQTLEQMDLVEAIIESRIGSDPGDWSTITVRFEFYELPTSQAVELERSAGEHFESTPELNAVLELVKIGRARIVTTANLLCRSGQRTAYRDGIEQPGFGDFKIEEDGGELVVRKRFPTQFVGTKIEADPVVGPDSRTMDLNFQIEHHIPVPADPSNPDGPRRHLTRVMNSSETLLSGAVKLLGSWPASESGEEPPQSRIVFLKAVAVADLLRDQS